MITATFARRNDYIPTTIFRCVSYVCVIIFCNQANSYTIHQCMVGSQTLVDHNQIINVEAEYKHMFFFTSVAITIICGLLNSIVFGNL